MVDQHLQQQLASLKQQQQLQHQILLHQYQQQRQQLEQEHEKQLQEHIKVSDRDALGPLLCLSVCLCLCPPVCLCLFLTAPLFYLFSFSVSLPLSFSPSAPLSLSLVPALPPLFFSASRLLSAFYDMYHFKSHSFYVNRTDRNVCVLLLVPL